MNLYAITRKQIEERINKLDTDRKAALAKYMAAKQFLAETQHATLGIIEAAEQRADAWEQEVIRISTLITSMWKEAAWLRRREHRFAQNLDQQAIASVEQPLYIGLQR